MQHLDDVLFRRNIAFTTRNGKWRNLPERSGYLWEILYEVKTPRPRGQQILAILVGNVSASHHINPGQKTVRP